MYSKCTLCERRCGIDRSRSVGYCGAFDGVRVARVSLHMWEEPIISGDRGSGTIFFSGCSLKCVYCQNCRISRGEVGALMSESDLAAAMLDLQERGAHNINLVTPTHYAPSIIAAVREARAARLSIPIVYNTAAYESEYTIDMLKDVVDIWLPDLKYYSAATAKSYSFAEDLPKISRRNIERMYSYSGAPLIDDNGIMRRGVVVRVLLLPGHVAEAKLNLKYLHNTFGDNIYVSIMSQYTPQKGLQPPLCRRVTADEYGELVDYAISLGIKKAFTQEYSSASESFIPDFDME